MSARTVTHNPEAAAAFAVAYRAGLAAAVGSHPGEYAIAKHGPTPEAFAETVSARMLATILTHPAGVSYDSRGMRNACKALGIKGTRTAILAYLGINIADRVQP